MLNGTCTLLQVRRASTVILCTEMQWENAIEKIKNEIQMQVRVWVRAQKSSSMVNSFGKLGAPDTENESKQQSNNTQGTAMHSSYGAKRLVNLI